MEDKNKKKDQLIEELKSLRKQFEVLQQKENALKKDSFFRASLIDNAAEGISVCHNISGYPHLKFNVWNHRMESLTGYTMEEINKTGWYQTVYPDPDVQAKAIERMGRMRHGDNLQTEPWEITRKDGEKRILNITTSVIESDEGTIYVLALMDDITEQKKAENSLLDRENKLKSIFRASPIGIGLVSSPGRMLLQVNEYLCNMIGYTGEELIGKSSRVLYPTDEEFEYVGREKYRQIQEQGVGTVETRWKRKDGGVIDVILSSAPINVSNLSLGVTFTALDITERKRAEEALLESEKRFRTIFKNAADGILLADIQEKIFYDSNPAMCTMLGYSPEEIKSLSVYSIHPKEDLPHVIEQFEKLARGQIKIALNIPILKKDGSVFYADISSSPVTMAGKQSLIGIFRDITERKRTEQEVRRMNEELEQKVSDRTAEVQRVNEALHERARALEYANKELEAFSYSVSHDLRAPLRHINGFVELLNQRTGETLDEESRHYLKVIAGSAKSMSMLIDDLLAFSRMGRTEFKGAKFSLGQLVQEAIRDLDEEMKGRNIDWKIAALPEVYGDRSMMKLVFINLLSNALKFTHTRKTAKIEIGVTAGERDFTFSIRDNGVGFNMNYADKLFGVFQRLHKKEEFEGTGIGLANVRRIITRHGGRTWAEGKSNKGATFYFTLPI